MRIDGVSDGKPAEKAGIIKGDVVVKMGTIDIVDMMSYMTGLSKFEKGNSTTVEVLRGGKIVEVKVTF
jgi:S1-C subfamily serine protease